MWRVISILRKSTTNMKSFDYAFIILIKNHLNYLARSTQRVCWLLFDVYQSFLYCYLKGFSSQWAEGKHPATWTVLLRIHVMKSVLGQLTCSNTNPWPWNMRVLMAFSPRFPFHLHMCVKWKVMYLYRIYIYIYVCICLCICVYIWVCVYMYMYIWAYVYSCMYMFLMCVCNLCMCVCMRVYACLYVCMYYFIVLDLSSTKVISSLEPLIPQCVFDILWDSCEMT